MELDFPAEHSTDPCGSQGQEKMGKTQGWAGVLSGGYWALVPMSVVEEGQYIGIRAPAMPGVVCMAEQCRFL